MKKDAEHLISEAIGLLGAHSSSRKPENDKQEPTISIDETGGDDQKAESPDTAETARPTVATEQEKAEVDQSKDTSPERSFWFKLAEQKL